MEVEEFFLLSLEGRPWQIDFVMGEVVNLNRFRKKKARQDKQKRAETNRRLHGRTPAERALEDAQKKKLEDKLGGAFLLRESVRMEDIPSGDLPGDFETLEAAVELAPDLGELSRSWQSLKDESTEPKEQESEVDSPQDS